MPALSLPRKIADAADATRCLDAIAESGQSPSVGAHASPGRSAVPCARPARPGGAPRP